MLFYTIEIEKVLCIVFLPREEWVRMARAREYFKRISTSMTSLKTRFLSDLKTF